jgi:drug/metabolite transporter (DMT)-like permease
MTSTPLSSIGLVLFGSLIGSFGMVFLKKAAAHLNKGFWYILNPSLFIGIALFLASSYFFVMGIRHGQLSVLYPMVSLGYVFTLFWSRIFFQEQFTRQKFVGLGLVLVGVAFVGLGS